LIDDHCRILPPQKTSKRMKQLVVPTGLGYHLG
jgi:hypothetical protein